MAIYLLPKILLVEFLKDRFWGPCCFYSVSTTFTMLLITQIWPLLTMTTHCLIVNALNPEELESRTNYLFSLAENWPTANKLIINTSKTKAMIIRPKLSSPPLTFLIGMENSPVQVTNTFRYLGVVLDNKLLFRNHINTLEKKIAPFNRYYY